MKHLLRISDWMGNRPLASTLLLATVVRGVLFYAGETGDSERYLAQAESILSGQGYGRNGTLDVRLPPGYPIFISLVFLVTKSHALLRAVQFVISVASCVLVAKAVGLQNKRASWIAGALMALALPLAHRTGYILSEVLTVFLMSLLCLALAWQQSRAETGFFERLGIGALCLLVILTAPGMLFLTGLIWLAVFAKNWYRPKALAGLVLGAMAIMIPWQAHCINAKGRILWTMYDVHSYAGMDANASGYWDWCRTWEMWPHEVRVHHFYKDVTLFDRVPSTAFASADEQQRLRALCAARIDGSISDNDFNAAFADVAKRRIAESPLEFHVLLPIKRACVLWLHMDKLWPAQPEYVGRFRLTTVQSDRQEVGSLRAGMRFGKAIYSTLVALTTVFYAAVFLWLSWHAISRGDLLAIAIVGGVVLYTAAGSYMAHNDERRNVPFYPALIFLMAYRPIKVTDDSSERGDEPTNRS